MVYIYVHIYIYMYIGISIYTMDVHGIYVQETEKQQKERGTNRRFFMLDGTRVYKTTLVYPFRIVMG